MLRITEDAAAHDWFDTLPHIFQARTCHALDIDIIV
jgi:hypothetical protein